MRKIGEKSVGQVRQTVEKTFEVAFSNILYSSSKSTILRIQARTNTSGLLRDPCDSREKLRPLRRALARIP